MALIVLLFSLIFFFPVGLEGATKSPKADTNTGVHRTPNADYRLGANDVIRVQVFGEDDLNTETRVSGDGKITLPLLGILEIKGLSVKETEELIVQRLSEGFLKNPRVSIYITKYRNVYVSGEVKNPGGYPYEDGLTVLKAITLAGGFTDKASKASRGRVKIKRMKGTQEETVPVQLEDSVLPDDIVVVPEYQNVYVSGQVRTPGGYPYEEGLTVLKAVTLAGGFTDKASKRGIQIKRSKGKEEESLSVKLEDSVFPDDVIVIPESFF